MDRIAISISRVSVLARDKKTIHLAIANRMLVNCAHNTSRAFIITP